MALTRSTASQRATAAAGGRTRGRHIELFALLAASLVSLAGLWLVYQAKAQGTAAVEAELGRGRAVNLNTVDRGEVLAPLLEQVLADPGERRFVAERTVAWLASAGGEKGTRVNSVGSLAAIRVTGKDLPASRSLPSLRERLAAREVASVQLLTPAQLAALRPSLVVRRPADFTRAVVWTAALFLVPFYLVHFWLRMRVPDADLLLLPAMHLLTGVGLVMAVSLRDPVRDALLFPRFAQGVAAGCLLLAAAATVDFQRSTLRRLSYVPLLGAMALSVLLVVFGSGPGTSDAKVNLLGVQPVEAIRLLVVFFLAGYFAQRWEFLRELKEPGLGRATLGLDIPRLDYVLPVLVGMALVLLFFFVQKDLGPALVLACVFLSLYGVARGRGTMVVVGLLLLAGGFAAGYALGYPHTVVQRIQMWVSPWNNAVRGGDQLAHAFWALGTGAVAGTGPGLGDPNLVPAAHTDLVLAAIGEELGFAGLLGVFAVLGLITWRSVRIALRAPGDYTFFLALGLCVSVVLQLVLIAGGLMGVVPLTGVATPFLSYGRSSMIANFLAFGIVLAISARAASRPATAEFARPAGVIAMALGVAFAVLAGRAAWLQVVRPDQTVAAAVLTVQADGARRYEYNPRLLAVAQQIPRGSVFDRNGVPLATSRPEELRAQAEVLSGLGFATPVACANNGARCYPFRGLTYHLLGDWRTQVNWSASNTSFVERDSDARLRGYDDRARVVEVADARGGPPIRVLRRDLRELVPLLRYRRRPEHKAVKQFLARPRDLRLSIDIRLQLRTASILRSSIERGGQRKGAAVVMSDNGDVLAAVSYPWPAIPATGVGQLVAAAATQGDERLLDRVRYGLYPPGSSFKVVTASAALRKDPALAQRTFTCVPLPDGRVGQRIPGWGRPIRDDPQDKTPHGVVALERGLVVSCNAYFAQLGLQLGAPALRETAALFEIPLGQPETDAQVRQTLPFAAYGQGQVLASPFKMARVAATIAAGGRMPEGRWLADDGKIPAASPHEVLSPPMAGMLARAMREVVTQGTGRALASVTPAIAGKTGTAEVQGAASHAWFVGFAPYGGTGRRVSFAVIVENGGYGARSAAPVAGNIVAAARELGII